MTELRAIVKTTDPWANGVSNIAALKALADSYQAGEVYLKGFHAPGDGGGGEFYWDDTSTATSIQGMIVRPDSIASDAGAGRWIRNHQGRVNVRWFGARGDNSTVAGDVTAETAAFQAAANWAVSRGVLEGYGGVVDVPPGTYRVNTISFDDGPLWWGAGANLTNIYHADGNATPLFHVTGGTSGTPPPASNGFGWRGMCLFGGSATTALIYYDGQVDNQTHFYDLWLEGQHPAEGGTAATDGISVRDYLNMRLDFMRLSHLGGWGINVRNAAHFTNASFSMTNFTYDNEFAVGGGKGLLYCDASSMSVEKGIIHLQDARLEINAKVSTVKPANGIIRFVQNTTRAEWSTPQFLLSIENVHSVVSDALGDSGKDMKLISSNVRDISLHLRNIVAYGFEEVYNNDAANAIDAISGARDGAMRIGLFTPFDHNVWSPPYRDQRPVRLAGQEFTKFGGVAELNEGFFKRGDTSLNNYPAAVSGNPGRAFAYKAVQDADGRHRGASQSLGTGNMTAGSAVLTMSAALSTNMLPGHNITVAGAGPAGAPLQGIVKSTNAAANQVTLDVTASTSVTGAAVTASAAKLMAVPMVLYGTAAPGSGTHKRGDIVINTEPSASGPWGWQCIVAGSPGTWQALNPTPNQVTLGADVAVATTALADLTGLSFPVLAGQVYRFYAYVPYSVNATTTGARFSINGPALTRGSWLVSLPPNTAPAGGANVVPQVSYQTAYNTLVPATTGSPAVDNNLAIIEGFVQPSAAGTIVVRFASEVAVANGVTARAGATLTYW